MEQTLTRARRALMAKKSTPTSPLPYSVVTAIEPAAVPPVALGEVGQKLWQSIQSQYRIEDAGGIELLRQACLAADRAERCRRIINTDGELIEGQNGGPPKEHPLLKSEHLARSYVAQTLTRLGLNVEPLRPGVGRPSGKAG